MNYTLHQLQVLAKVAELGSITRASEELNMTQPAVSIQMKNLQSQFDAPLTEVIGRKLHITAFGLQVAEIANRILLESKSIEQIAFASKGLLSGKLTVASVSTGKYVIPYFLSGFLRSNPGVELLLNVTNKASVVESLQRNKVDFALISQMPANLKLEEEVLMANNLYLIGNGRDKWPGGKEPKVLREVPLIFREKGSGTGTATDQYLDRHGVKVTRRMELTSNEAVKQAVLAGLGCSIMPEIGLGKELASGELQIVPLTGLPLRSQWRLVWLKGKRFSPVASAWMEHVRANRESLMREHFSWIKR